MSKKPVILAMNLPPNLRRALQVLRLQMERGADPRPLILFIPTVAFDRGEDWVRRAYGVGPDVEIRETLPLRKPSGESWSVPRRYPAASRPHA